MEESVEDIEMESNDSQNKKKKTKQVYLPHKPLKKDEELVCDESAYIMLRDLQTGAPCLSFDVITDELGNNRSEFPLSFYFVAGTQASKPKENCILVMKTSNLHKTQKSSEDEDDDEDEDSDDDDEEEEEGKAPKMDYASFTHFGCINRIRTTAFNNSIFAASWSEMGKVSIWDLKTQIQAVSDLRLLAKYRSDNLEVNTKPVFTFTGHQSEGFAVDWCSTTPGILATGDCKKNIHLWHPTEESWRVDQKPLLGHTKSVEDLQWSPNERNVLASASVDKSIRIWDTRLAGTKACMISVDSAHESDVNVISWNRNEPFIISGGDDGCIHVWDLRSIQTGKSVATFKHHTKPVTTIEWHPTEATVFASGGEDDQIALWDLGVEKDADTMEEDLESLRTCLDLGTKHFPFSVYETACQLKFDFNTFPALSSFLLKLGLKAETIKSCENDLDLSLYNIPPQLLFIHQGQKEIKELHWHPQIPGLVISTAYSGFNIFRTISV